MHSFHCFAEDCPPKASRAVISTPLATPETTIILGFLDRNDDIMPAMVPAPKELNKSFFPLDILKEHLDAE